MRPRYVSVAHIVAGMTMHVRVTAAALILLALTTACERTTPGTVAMTTQPGPPLTASPRTPSTAAPNFPNIPIPDIPIPGFPRRTDIPEVPAPPNALTMTCEEFNDLDEATRLAVIRAILAKENNPLGPNGEGVGQMLAEAACQFLPKATVSEVLLGSPPP
jgi:hypothetical protein